MPTVLVTGGTGTLGRLLVPRLQSAGYDVYVLTRRPPADPQPLVNYRVADLATGVGLAEAVVGIDVIVHAASNPRRSTAQTDLDGTRMLLEHAQRAGIRHFLYMSIVGVDRHPLPYYRVKFAAEQLVRQSQVPWSILRATQFHQMLDYMFHSLKRLPVWPLPSRIPVQSIDPGEVAARISAMVGAGPAGDVPDIGGPQVMMLRDMAKRWLQAHGMRRLIIPAPLFGNAIAAYRDGLHLAPDHPFGRISWSDWLAQRAHTPSRRRAVARAVTLLVGVGYAAAGGALLLAPAWFFNHVGNFPPYNRHYEGDLGSFLLAIGVGLIMASRSLGRHRLVLGVALLGSAIHVGNHLFDAVRDGASVAHWLTDTLPLAIGLAPLVWAWLQAKEERG